LIGVKVYVVCDIEGVAGVVDFKLQCMTEGRYYDQAVRIATLELNALVEGVLREEPRRSTLGQVTGPSQGA